MKSQRSFKMRLQKVKAPLKFGIFKERHRYSDYVQSCFWELPLCSSSYTRWLGRPSHLRLRTPIMWGMLKLRYRTQKSSFICIHAGDANTDVLYTPSIPIDQQRLHAPKCLKHYQHWLYSQASFSIIVNLTIHLRSRTTSSRKNPPFSSVSKTLLLLCYSDFQCSFSSLRWWLSAIYVDEGHRT